MTKRNLKLAIAFSGTIVLTLGLSLSLSSLLAQISGPTAPPPGNNVSGPLHSGDVYQTKTGPLHIDSSNNSLPALTVTNTGSNLSFRVNDEAGDTTPFVIDASGNVGIGTPGPTALLDINGIMRLRGHFYDSNNSAGSNGQVLTRTTSGPAWQVPSTPSFSLSCETRTCAVGTAYGSTCTVSCSSGYVVTGCSIISPSTLVQLTWYGAYPNTNTSCICAGFSSYADTCYARCCRIN